MSDKVKASSKVQATARIQLTIEIKATSPWGPDCQIGQLYDQAKGEAMENLWALLKPGAMAQLTVVGEPKVIGVITEKV
jgi:hypothetical protein